MTISKQKVVKSSQDVGSKFYCTHCKKNTPCSIYNWGIKCEGEINWEKENLKTYKFENSTTIKIQ